MPFVFVGHICSLVVTRYMLLSAAGRRHVRQVHAYLRVCIGSYIHAAQQKIVTVLARETTEARDMLPVVLCVVVALWQSAHMLRRFIIQSYIRRSAVLFMQKSAMP